MSAAKPTSRLDVTVTARPIRWKRDKQNGQWIDQAYGFCVWTNKTYTLPAFASWDSGMAAHMLNGSNEADKQFQTMTAAKDWCQAQANHWVARHSVLTPKRSIANATGAPK